MSDSVLSFDVEQARRGASARSDRGLQLVELAHITGSVGRAGVLDRRFRYRRGVAPRDGEHRARRLRRLFDDGRVPPLELYRIADDYFVVDGHHRVAVAHERGQTDIEARVIEYLPTGDHPADAVYLERRTFERATGLHGVRATEPGRYPHLLSRVRDHRHQLVREASAGEDSWPPAPFAGAATELPDLRRAARDWHEREYRLVVGALLAARPTDALAGRAPGDLYGYVSDHRWYLSERRGFDVGIDAALADYLRHHLPALDPIGGSGSRMGGAGESRLAGLDAARALAVGLLLRTRSAMVKLRGVLLSALREPGAGAAPQTPAAEPGTAPPEPKVRKRLALVAHDDRKADLLEWARFNREVLAGHELFATGTTGRLVEERLGLPVTKLKSGPLGGDQQIGAMIADGALDCLVFFWDPMQPLPHDSDVKALLRIAALWNVPLACNRASADFLISSPLMAAPYQRLIPEHAA
jgi:methylglyoxal synthase